MEQNNMNGNGGQYRQNNNQPVKAENSNSTSTCNNKNVCMKSAAIGFGTGVVTTLGFFGVKALIMKGKMKKALKKAAEKETAAPAPEKEAK